LTSTRLSPPPARPQVGAPWLIPGGFGRGGEAPTGERHGRQNDKGAGIRPVPLEFGVNGGWVPFNANWWPKVAENIPKPWPRELVLFDLRWWADHENMQRGSRPGRPALRRRWGWTDYATKQAMKAENEWGTPIGMGKPTKQESPADHQPADGSKPNIGQFSPANRPRRARARSSLYRPTYSSREEDWTTTEAHATYCWCRDNEEPPPHASEQDLSAAADHARRYHLPVPTCLQHLANVVPFRASQQEEA